MSERGWFGIGIYHGKRAVNIGTLWRSASILGADFVYTIGRRYQKQPGDTMDATRHIPLYNYVDLDDLIAHLPQGGTLVGVEMLPQARALSEIVHPERAVYLLGAEGHGLSNDAIQRCHMLVRLPGDRPMNVSTVGSIVLYDRTVRGTAHIDPIPKLASLSTAQ